MEKSAFVDGKNGIASMIQVEAKSTMEGYMYKDTGSLSVFKSSYKQHTKFDKETCFLKSDTEPRFGSSVLYNFDVTKCEMICNLVLRIELDGLPSGYVWANGTGYAVIDTVTIINGEDELVTFSGHYLFTQFVLNTQKSKQTGTNAMIGYHNSRRSLNGRPQSLYAPIPFMSTLLDKQYYPLFISDKATFQIRVRFRPLREVVLQTGENVDVSLRATSNNQQVRVTMSTNSEIEDVALRTELLYDAIHLTKEERLRYVSPAKHTLLYYKTQESHEYIQRSENVKNCLLDFSGTVSHLIITMRRTNHYDFLPVDTFTLILNGTVVGPTDTDANSYRYYNNNLSTPSKHVYVIPFGLSCVQTQPSGTYTFHGKQNSVIVLKRSVSDFVAKITITSVIQSRLEFANGCVHCVL